jgi:photosystem II stability/assembly factor-like uncharacterized protein
MMNTILKAYITFVFSIIILFIIFVSVNAQEKGQWEILNEGKGGIQSMGFITENVGWIAGFGKLWKTGDGGETWHAIPFGENWRIEQIDFKNDLHGWAVIDTEENDGQSSLYTTEDGGLIWQLSCILPQIGKRWDLTVINDSVIYLVGTADNNVMCDGPGWILKSIDGGLSWNDITPASLLSNISSISIYFYNTDVGMVIGHCSDEIKIIITVNGGTSWEETPTDFTSFGSFQFVNDSVAYFVAEKSDEDKTEYYFCATADSLKTFTIKNQYGYPIGSFYCLNKNIIYAIMLDSLGNKNIMKSADGGSTWEAKVGIYGRYDKIFMVNSDVGFLLGSRMRYSFLMKTTDGGDTWSYLIFSDRLMDVWFMNSRMGFACAGWKIGIPHGTILGGSLFFSNDGGETWGDINEHPNGLQVKSCFFINENVGFTLGSNYSYGRGGHSGWNSIYKTIDGGMNWFTVYKDTVGLFVSNDICFRNDQIGWAVGRGGWPVDTSGARIFGTLDGGENWDLAWKYTNKDDYWYELNSIHSAGTNAWAVGESGLIAKYTEHDMWQPVTGVTDLPLQTVFFSEENHGWIAGGYLNNEDFQSILLKTSDGGETWQENRDLNYQINDMYFENNRHGWAVGNDTSGSGMILETHSGGDKWKPQIDDLSAPLTALHFKDGFGWAVGGNGLVLRTDNGVDWIDPATGGVYPSKYSLSQNYPNPFNSITMISYQLVNTSEVELSIYSLLGQKVATLVNKKQPAGIYTVQWDAKDFAGGVYLYQLKTSRGFRQSRKLLYLK